MKKRTIPEVPIYRGEDRNLAIILERIRESITKMLDDDFITERDIYCKDLITSGDSIYIGSKKPENKIKIKDGVLLVANKPITGIGSTTQTEIISGNVDGGNPDSDYGGLEVIDCGGV